MPETPTVELVAVLAGARRACDTETAYELTRAVWQEATRKNLDQASAAGKALDLQLAIAGVSVPSTMARSKYYDEHGVTLLPAGAPCAPTRPSRRRPLKSGRHATLEKPRRNLTRGPKGGPGSCDGAIFLPIIPPIILRDLANGSPVLLALLALPPGHRRLYHHALTEPNRTATEQLLSPPPRESPSAEPRFRRVGRQEGLHRAGELQGLRRRIRHRRHPRSRRCARACALCKKKKDAECIIEIRAGALSADQKKLLIGIPSFDLPDAARRRRLHLPGNRAL